MAFLYCDSMDHYATAQIGLKWSTNSGGTITANGRSGTSCLEFTGQSSFARRTFTATDTLIWGAAFDFGSLPSADALVVRFEDSNSAQFGLFVTSTGKLRVVGGIVDSTGTTTVTAGYHYIEIKAVINNTTGSYEVRLDGATELSGSGTDTQTTANAFVNDILVAGAGNVAGGPYRYDDMVVMNGTSAGTPPNNDFLGDVRVSALLPNGVGVTTQWTPLAGANWENVDDPTPDGDSTYNSSLTPGQIDTYALADLSGSGTVYGVQALLYARKDDAGTREVAPVLRSASTDAVGTTVAMTTSFAYVRQVYDLNPVTAAAWSVSEVNALEAGIREVQ